MSTTPTTELLTIEKLLFAKDDKLGDFTTRISKLYSGELSLNPFKATSLVFYQDFENDSIPVAFIPNYSFTQSVFFEQFYRIDPEAAEAALQRNSKFKLIN